MFPCVTTNIGVENTRSQNLNPGELNKKYTAQILQPSEWLVLSHLGHSNKRCGIEGGKKYVDSEVNCNKKGHHCFSWYVVNSGRLLGTFPAQYLLVETQSYEMCRKNLIILKVWNHAKENKKWLVFETITTQKVNDVCTALTRNSWEKYLSLSTRLSSLYLKIWRC